MLLHAAPTPAQQPNDAEYTALVVTEGNSARLPVDFGFTPTVSVVATPRLLPRGAVFRNRAMERTSPMNHK